MAADVEPDLKLEIAHVLTIDIVAYSTLLIHEQSHVMAELNRSVRNTPRFRGAEADGKLVRLPTGDGMALVFYGDPEAPIECAMQISTELKSHPEVWLRMGIHSGPINQILDVNDHSNVAGAGIDMAQRVMDCGDAGHILLSKRVADDLAPYSRWHRHLHDLGECEVKHGRRISVSNFYTDAIGNPNPPRKMQAASEAAHAESNHRRWIFAAAAALLLTASLLAFFFWTRSPAPQNSERAIAVLPFLDLSQAKDQEYFSDGITEQIINSLGKIRGLFVVARSSSFVFKNKSQDIREIGRLLGVTHVIEGSVSRDAGRVRVDAHLINVTNGYQLWAESYDSSAHDALSVQSDVAQKVANALQVELQLKETSALAQIATEDPEANDLYLRGRYLLNKRTSESMEKAKTLFEGAVAKDRRFALGRVGIADAFILLGKNGTITGEEAASRAWLEVSAALGIDDRLADAYVSRGTLLTDFEWNWPAAEIDFRKALILNPNSGAAHHWYARHLAQIGRWQEAQREITAALKHDPLSPMIKVTEAKILFLSHQYEQAVEPCQAALELEPNYATAFSILGQAYAHMGAHAKGIEAAQNYANLSGDSGWAKLELAYAYAVAGDRANCDKIVEEVTTKLPEEFSPYDMAAICSAWHNEVGAVRWLEEAIEKRSVDVVDIRVDPRLDNVRASPGFKEILGRMVARR